MASWLVSHRPSGWGRKGGVPRGPGCRSSSPRFVAQLTWAHVWSASAPSSVLGTPRALDTRRPRPQAGGEGSLGRVGASFGRKRSDQEVPESAAPLEKVGSGRRWRPCPGDTRGDKGWDPHGALCSPFPLHWPEPVAVGGGETPDGQRNPA